MRKTCVSANEIHEDEKLTLNDYTNHKIHFCYIKNICIQAITIHEEEKIHLIDDTNHTQKCMPGARNKKDWLCIHFLL